MKAEQKLSLIPAHYLPRMMSPAYVILNTPHSIAFNINKAQINEDEYVVTIKIGFGTIMLSKNNNSVNINIR